MTNQPHVAVDAKALEAVSSAIEQMPYTAYSFVAQNKAVERARAIKHARSVAAIAVRNALASSERSGREAEYLPTILRNDSAGFYEFVTEDVPALYSGMMAANVERIGNLKGDLIGFRIYDDTSDAAIRNLAGTKTNEPHDAE